MAIRSADDFPWRRPHDSSFLTHCLRIAGAASCARNPVIALTVTLFSSAPGAQADALALRAAMQKLAPAVLRIEAARGEHGRNAMGSGVVIAAERVVTNCHVVRDAASVAVRSGTTRWQATARQAQPQSDVCILTVPGLDITPVDLGTADIPQIGNAVLALGYSGGFGLSPSTGEITAVHAFDGAYVIQTTAAFSSGASGGGLFDPQGRLVGLLTFRLLARGAYFFAIPVQWVARAAASEAVAIAPIDGAKSFWEGRPGELPYFLRATTLEAAGDKPELLHLTARWLEEEPENGDAREFRRRALTVQQ